MNATPTAVRASAPGKIVLWGEYAVLAGAPALVMAVNRYATCRLDASETDGWQFSASGFEAAATRVSRRQLLEADDEPDPGAPWRVLRHVLQTLPAATRAELPDGVRAHFDTRSFHRQGAKLGLGSSAALCVAVYGAVCGLLARPPRFEEALAAHRSFQGGGGIRAGSGIDVAAAWHGGVLRCERQGNAPASRPWALPSDLQVAGVWTGTSASTPDHLERLQRWLDAGRARELDELGVRAEALFDSGADAEALTGYVAALAALDRAAGLGIFSDAHRRLGELAIDAGVVYKPCGAGGGDLGAAFARSADAIERFHHLAAAAGFLPLALEAASHGIEVTG